MSIVERVVGVLKGATEPLTAEEICKRVFGRVGERQRNTIKVTLFRLVDAKRAKKREAMWELT